MLTPSQIKNYEFTKVKNGYSIAEVDEFMEKIFESYEQMFKENGDLYKKVLQCAEKLKTARQDEINIQNALLNAQRTSAQIIKEAEEKAANIISEAESSSKSNLVISDVESQAEDIVAAATAESINAAKAAIKEREDAENSLKEMKQNVEKFRQTVVEMYKAQLSYLETQDDNQVKETE